jgi:hypothetical protein
MGKYPEPCLLYQRAKPERLNAYGIPLAKIPDKSFNPIRIRLLGTYAVVFEASLAAYLIQ